MNDLALIHSTSTDARPAPVHAEGIDLAGLQGDGHARASDDGRRRVLACASLPRGATPQVCVAAWHGVLHWLRHDDQPVSTCQVGRWANACWTLVTVAGATTSLAQLLAEVSAQWVPPHGDWLDLDEPEHAGLIATLRHHAIRLEPGPEEASPELALVHCGKGWQIACATNRYSERYQQFLLALWQQFVATLLQRPGSLLSELAGPAAEAGAAGPAAQIDSTLVQGLADLAAALPDKPAVIDEHGSLSLAGLHALSSAWAQALREAGVQRGDYVGVAFGRSRAMVAAQLAVLKAGAAFVPMDAAQPAARLQAMQEDTDMRVALGDAASVAALRACLPGVQGLVAEDLPQTGEHANPAPAAPPAGTDDPAYVIFTSGSTGRPKGVKVSHGNLLNFIAHLGHWVGPDDVTSQFAPFTFDASVAEIHSALLNGATQVILPAALIEDPERLQAYMSEQGVTFAAFPPQYAQHLSPAKLPRLKTLLTAGSAPDHALIARWQPHLRYINAYGPTETTILSTAWQANRVPGVHEPIVIGKPISNTEVRVVNRFNQPLPAGVIGELLIGGAGVTHGYLKREALTRERFITMGRTRWYRSGDLSWFDPEGQLIFAGRVDRQLKLRGRRLEPGEVEAALLAQAGIREAAVAALDLPAGKQLVAFCAGEALDDQALRERLGHLLPEWALPHRTVWLPQLPLTPNGKTDYQRLVADLEADLAAKAQAKTPTGAPAEPADLADELEAQIAEIWRGVLQQPHISRDDHFIRLGGDSLTALVVTSAIKRLGYAPSSAHLLQHPRLADYARLLRAAGKQGERDYASRAGAAPLTPIQGWFFSLQLAHPGTFCQSLVFDSDVAIDPQRLAQACGQLAGYHDQLRARFMPGADGWQQEILHDTLPLPAPQVITIADTLLDATTEAWARQIAEQLRLDVAPLFRLAVIRTPARSRVVWVLHHLIVDTVSHGVLLDDLHRLYQAAEAGPADVRAVLPGKSLAYGDWAGRLQERVNQDPGALLQAWRPVLDGVAKADALPLAASRSTAAPVVVCQARLSRADTARLTDEATACYRQSPEELVLAATYRALAGALKLKHVAIDIEWHGRDETLASPQGVDRSVGWFTSVHPLCIAVDDRDLGTWLMALKEARAAVPQRGRDFQALRYCSRDAAVRAAFAGYRPPQVLFNFSGRVQRRHDGWCTVPVAAIEMGEGNANPYALSVETEIRDGELVVSGYSRPELWPAGAAQQLGQALSQALQAIIGHCSNPAHRRWTPADFPQLSLTQAQADELPLSCTAAYPLTDMQQTLWRHKDTYQVVMCYRMPRRFDAARWTGAVADWISRHDCLRTQVKEWPGGATCQVVLDRLASPITTHLTTHRVAAGTGRQRAEALIEQVRQAPVQVHQAPLFHVHAIDEEGDDFLVVLAIHHLIHDGWSIERLLGDLLQTYRHDGGEACPRPGAPLASLADIVAQQQALRASPAWRDHWLGLPWEGSASQLPAVTPQQDGSGPPARREVRLHLGAIDPGLAAAVRAQACALGVTVNSLWLAGYAALLRYLGGQAQVRCGVIQSGRSEDIVGVDTITGCCVNTLPLVLDIRPEHTPAAIVAAVNSQLGRMRAAAAYPLSHIHELAKPRIEGELFATLFNIESQRYGEPGGQPLPTLEGGYEATNHAFIFGLIEQAGDTPAAPPRYQVRIGYDTALYDEPSVAGWLDIYAHCMHLLATQADVPWSRLPLLPPALREQVVSQWNDTDHAYRHEHCLHDLIAEQAARTPHAVALVYEGQSLSYQALEQRGNQLAQHLRTLGVGPDVVVGCCFERSIEMVVGLLGVLKAGGAYVPLDPDLPAQRLDGMLADVGIGLVLTQDALANERLAQLQAPVQLLRLDADWARVAACPATAPHSGVKPHHLAYVIFTSGSTGKPKAAMNEHGALVNRLQWMQQAYGLDSTDRVLQKTPFSFDVSVWEFFWPLFTGATLVIARPGGHREPGYLGALIRDSGITTLHFVPSMLQVFVDEGGLASCTSVRRVITSGEALSGALSARFLALSAAELHNLYGPTEAAIDVSYHPVTRASTGGEPIGRPIWNTRLYVLDAGMQPLPAGVSGELYIGGLAVGRGYLNRPDLTAERFVQSPFVAGERLYRTGDLARWRHDGTLEFLGRLDHQVKIRGQRVELGEIEHAICTHPAVRQAVVVLRTDSGHPQLVAYLLARSADAADPELIRSLAEHLRASLPAYMVPAAFVTLEAMPLNANGKTDRARLPEPGPSAFVRNDFVAPDTDAERALWAIWRDVLGSQAFGVTDGFYAIGGDSIQAIQVASRAARQGLALTPRHIVEEQTIRKLASRAAAPVQKAALPPAERPVQGQQRLLPIQLQFLRDGADVDRYGQYMLAELPQDVTADMLRAALAALVARHDVLRLTFRHGAGGWVAYYRPELLAATPEMMDAWIDSTGPVAGFDPDVQVAELMATLDIRRGRLLGWRVVLQGGQRRLLWVMHHLVVDAVSWRLLAADLDAVLAQLVRGEAPVFDARPASYQDWAARLHDHAYSPALEQERSHWLAQAAQPCARLRFDRGDAGTGTPPEASTASVAASLGTDDTRALLQAAHARHGTRTPHLLLAALGRTLGHWLQADAIRIDLEGHGREAPQGDALFDGIDVSRTVGWFTTLYPVALDHLRADLGTLIQSTRARLDAVPHGGLGHGVLRLLAQDEDLAAAEAHGPEVLFNYLGQFDAAMVGGSRIGAQRRRTHALRIEALVRDGDLQVRIDYSRDQFEPGTLATLMAQYLQALRDIIGPGAGPTQRPTEEALQLAGLTPPQWQAVKARYPAVAAVYPCTGMQQALLLAGARAAGGAYLTQMRITLEGADPARLRQGWQVLLQRHEMLRSAFFDGGQNVLLQVVCGDADLPWRELDARALDAPALEQLLNEERTLAFDTEAAPLMRLLLLRTGEHRHCLVWTHHHALLDGWSIGLLIKELFETYAHTPSPASAGEANLHTPSPASAGEGAAPRPTWRHHVQWLQSRDPSAAQAYWRAYFDGLDLAASASLPTTPHDAAADDGQALQTLELPAEAGARLTRLARTESVGMGTLVFAAWALLLSKHSAEPDVLFGYSTSGRSPQLAGSESVVGLCINSLPLRLRIDGKQKLGAWLKEIQRRQLDHEDHGHLALADIQRCSGLPAGQSLFDSLVAFENYPLDRALPPGDANLPRLVGVQGVEQNDFALNLAVYPGERMTLKLAYRRALFSADRIATLLGQLERLLVHFGRGGAQTLAQLSLLNAEERQRALVQWNDTAQAYPRDQALPALFEAMAERRGAAPAIVSGGQTWSYAQLQAQVHSLSAWLAGHGVGAGSRVALSLRKEPALVAAMLAVMRLGAAYVPIALDCPAERRAFLLADAGICCTLTRHSEREALADANLLCLEDCPAAISAAHAPAAVDPEATAYVIYTSGTTGTPKGVAISHRNLVNFCTWCTHAGLFRAGDRITQFAPYTFDASAGEIFAGLLGGTELHLLSDALIQDPRALMQYLCDQDIRFAAFPPTYLEQMDPARVPPQLTLLTAGSAPQPELVRRWGACCRYINGYGPTETTILSSAWICERGQVDVARLSIGQPIANTTMVVVDALGQPCPPGLLGEIWIGGDGVAQGYLNRPELTQAQFMADPFRPGGRLYRTSDLGRWREDGRIEFVGRRDRQVKLRGFRIELNEVEGQVRLHPGVKDAAVGVRGDGAEQQLLCWIVPRQDGAGAEFLDSLRGFLRQALPHYMLPQAFMVMAQLPLTAHGKVDDRALPLPQGREASPQAHVAPGTATQARIAQVWAAVLKLQPEQVGAQAHFFEIGGQSLLAMRAVSRLREELAIDISVADLFAHPVLADLAAWVDRAAGAVQPGIEPVPRDAPLPLSFAQQRLWFLAQMEGLSRIYHVPGALRLRGRLDTTALRRALDRIVARHEGLRTTFHLVDGEPQQRIAEAGSGFALAEHDLSGCFGTAPSPTSVGEGWGEGKQTWQDTANDPSNDKTKTPSPHPSPADAGEGACGCASPADAGEGACGCASPADAGEGANLAEAEIERRAREEALAPFDLARGPLVRGQLLRLAPDHHVLLVTQHHIVSDGWSIGVMVQELKALYAAFVQGRPDPLPPLAVQYADYAAWQRRWLQGEALQRQVAFWRRTLDGAPALLTLPGDRPRPAQRSHGGDGVPLKLPAALVQGLRALGQRHGVTLFMTLLGAWSVLLSRLSGQDDVVIGSPVTNRPHTELEPLIGFFVNTLALRVRLDGEPSVAELLARIKALTVDAYAHQDLPFEQVVEAVNPQRDLGHSPVFQALFSLQTQQTGALQLPGVSLEPIGQPPASSRFDLSLALQEDDEGVAGLLGYATDLFDRGTIERWSAHLLALLDGMVRHEDQAATTLPLLDAAERERVLHRFNDTQRPFPDQRLVHELFEAQAAATPQALAVSDTRQRLSYGELNAQANQLARHLRSRGVGPGKLVAVCAERSVALLVALLGVLKAGGAYVPLDPANPAQRLQDILGDAQPQVLLTQQKLRAQLPRCSAEVLALDTDWDRIGSQATGNLDGAALGFDAGQLAYVIFTSGSTGRPKGVMIEHRAIVNYAHCMVDQLGVADGEGSLVFTSFSFDLTLTGLYPPLLCGRAVHLCPQDNDAEAWRRELLAGRAFAPLKLTPSHLALLRQQLPEQAVAGRIRSLVLGGEALQGESLRWWREQAPDMRIFNHYGPTETTVGCVVNEVTDLHDGPVPIGRPIANMRMYILDTARQPVPVGVAGELYIAGVGVARGYLNRPDLTAERFLDDPFAAEPGARMYRTGDVARWRNDGRIDYLGRNDHQVKLRGFRIELGEIESCLVRHPLVREAVVVARGQGAEDLKLVAYVALDDEVDTDVMQAYLRRHLPDYMVPTAIVVLDELPLNANGKVDRKALPEPTETAWVRAEYEAPRSDTERAIAALWQELLKVPQVGRADNYFDLGGNSLLLIRMLSRLKSQGLELGVTEVYKLRTLSACAAAIDAQRAGAAQWPLDAGWRHALLSVQGRSVLLLDAAERPRHAELQTLLAGVAPAERPHLVRYGDLATLPQQLARDGLAVLVPAADEAALIGGLRARLQAQQQQLAGAPTEDVLRFSPGQCNLMAWQHRDVSGVLHLEGWHDAQELQQAFAAAAAEQDLLRATLDGELRQWRLLPAGAIAAAPLPVVDLRGQDPGCVEGLLHRIGHELLAAKKTAVLPYVAAVVSLSDLQHQVLLAVDHLVWDRTSALVLQRRLQERLRGQVTPLGATYRDYVEAAWHLPDEAALAQWRQAMPPADLIGAMGATQRALVRRAHQPLQVVALHLPAPADGTAADHAFGAFKRCVAQLTGLARHGLMLDFHGREFGGRGWFDQVGLFLDKVPFAVGADTTLAELADRAGLLQKLGIHHAGLAGPEWRGTQPALQYGVMFNFLTQAPQAPDEAHLREQLQDYRGILFEAAADGGELRGHCSFRGDARDAEAIRRLLAGEQPEPPAPPPPPAWALEVREVRKRYGEFEAVRGVSFCVPRGGCFGILGPNGAGKTSLLGMIEGIVPISAGSIQVLGMDVGRELHRIQPHLGVQLQQNHYFKFLTVAQLLKFYQALRGAVGGAVGRVAGGQRRGRPVDLLLQRLDLHDKLGFKVDQLSGGQKQRLSIAIALLEDPDVVFLDEPTSALDPHSRIATWAFIEELKQEPGKTVILTTHYMEEAERLCDEILLMDRGRVMAQGSPAELARQLAPRHSIRFQFGRGQFKPELLHGIAEAADLAWDARADSLCVHTTQVSDTLPAVLARTQAAGIAVVHIDIHRPTLEDVFLTHTGGPASPPRSPDRPAPGSAPHIQGALL